jgi:hypothetical protein
MIVFFNFVHLPSAMEDNNTDPVIILHKGLTWKKQVDKAIDKAYKRSGHAQAHLGKLD